MSRRDPKGFASQIGDGLRDRLSKLEHLKATGVVPPDTQKRIDAICALLELDQFKKASLSYCAGGSPTTPAKGLMRETHVLPLPVAARRTVPRKLCR